MNESFHTKFQTELSHINTDKDVPIFFSFDIVTVRWKDTHVEV